MNPILAVLVVLAEDQTDCGGGPQGLPVPQLRIRNETESHGGKENVCMNLCRGDETLQSHRCGAYPLQTGCGNHGFLLENIPFQPLDDHHLHETHFQSYPNL